MLLANMAVAAKISSHFAEISLLRRHESPKPRPLNEFVEFAKLIGIDMVRVKLCDCFLFVKFLEFRMQNLQLRFKTLLMQSRTPISRMS
jgi:hypothetical protein